MDGWLHAGPLKIKNRLGMQPLPPGTISSGRAHSWQRREAEISTLLFSFSMRLSAGRHVERRRRRIEDEIVETRRLGTRDESGRSSSAGIGEQTRPRRNCVGPYSLGDSEREREAEVGVPRGNSSIMAA